MARLVRVPISVELFQQWITEGFDIGYPDRIVCEVGLPEGAEFVKFGRGTHYPFTLEMIFQDSSFDDVPEGDDMPILKPTFRRYDKYRPVIEEGG